MLGLLMVGMAGCGKSKEPTDAVPVMPTRPAEDTPRVADLEDTDAEPATEAVAEDTPEPEAPAEPVEEAPAEPEVTEDAAPPAEVKKAEKKADKPAEEAVAKPAPKPTKPEPAPEPARLKSEPAKAPEEPDVAKEPAAPAKPKDGATRVIATVEVASNVPDASEVPYTECVTFVKYRVDSVASGSYDGKEILAVLWGMRDSKRQPAADFKPGQRHTLTVTPFSERGDLARVMQADDTDEYSLEPYWVSSYALP